VEIEGIWRLREDRRKTKWRGRMKGSKDMPDFVLSNFTVVGSLPLIASFFFFGMNCQYLIMIQFLSYVRLFPNFIFFSNNIVLDFIDFVY